MKTVFTLIFIFSVSLAFAQYGGGGFFDLSYATIGENFIDETSKGFDNPEIQLNESGIGIGGSGKFFFSKFSVGGGGGLAFIRSDSDLVKMNVGHGYGTFGYNFVFAEDMIVNASARLGGFGNTLSVDPGENASMVFGDQAILDAVSFTSGSFMYGAEVEVLRLIPQVPGLILGISGYFTAPINLLTWYNGAGEAVTGFEQGEYTHFGIMLKIGVGGINY